MCDPVTILHVDDDPAFADLTAEMLERLQPGLTVRTETDPEAGLEMLQTARDDIDAIVTDYQMPSLTGIELLRRIDTRFPDQFWPKLLFTGEGTEAVAADALHAGATSYVQKGSTDTFEYLAERLQHDLRVARAKQNSVRFSALTAALDDPVYVLDSDGRFVYVNDAFVELTGYDRDTIIGSPPALVKPAISVRTGERQLGQLLSEAGPESVTFEIEIETADGDRIPCEDHMGVLPYEGDAFRGSLGTLRDISEQKAREDAIRAAKNQYQTLVEQNLVGLYIAREGTVIYHNEPFAALFGYDPDTNALTDQPLTAVVESADRPRLTRMLRETELGDRDAIREPYIGQRADGNTIEIQLLARGIELDGTPAVIGTVIDSADETPTTAEVRAERDRLAEFAGVVSHDLRNPLAVAAGRAELLATEHADNEHVAAIQQSLDRMDTIIEDLLSLARNGETLGGTELVDLESVATSCWETVTTEDASLSVTVDQTIRADRSRLKQLFENLYRNAVDHAGTGVTITVGELADGFFIADDGPGINVTDRDQVFTPGYSTSDSGTGFGLAIVSQIVDAHGWTIICGESAAGGAQFEITGVGG